MRLSGDEDSFVNVYCNLCRLHLIYYIEVPRRQTLVHAKSQV